MQNRTRFTLSYSALALGTAGLLVLTGCSGEPSKTSGLLDDVKYVKAVKAVPAKTHQVSQKTPETVSYCKTKNKNGSCKTWGTKKTGRYVTSYVTVTDAPGKPGKSAMWCVELDRVQGDQDHNDQWYEVSWKTYSKWENEIEGTKVTDMEYFRSLSKCKH